MRQLESVFWTATAWRWIMLRDAEFLLRFGPTCTEKHSTLLPECLLTERTGNVSTTWRSSRSQQCTAAAKYGKPIKYTGYNKTRVTELVQYRWDRLIDWERKCANGPDWIEHSLAFHSWPSGWRASRNTVFWQMLLKCKVILWDRNIFVVVIICTAQWSLYVPHSGHYMYRTVVTICTNSLTFNNPTFCPRTVFMCFVWISEQTAIISLYNINWLVFITETQCVYCAVRTGCLYTLRSVSLPKALPHILTTVTSPAITPLISSQQANFHFKDAVRSCKHATVPA